MSINRVYLLNIGLPKAIRWVNTKIDAYGGSRKYFYILTIENFDEYIILVIGNFLKFH